MPRLPRAALGLALATLCLGVGGPARAAGGAVAAPVLDLAEDPFAPMEGEAPRTLAAVERLERERDAEVLEVAWRVDGAGDVVEEMVWLGPDATLWVGERPVERRVGDWLAGIELSETGDDDAGIEVVVYTTREPGEEERARAALRLAANGLDLGRVDVVGRPVEAMVGSGEVALLLRAPSGQLMEATVPTLATLVREGVPLPPRLTPTSEEAWKQRTRLDD